MRKITAGLFISLDGVVEAPDQWHFPYFNEEMGASVDAQIGAADTMLLGRKTYEGFAEAWPERELAGEDDAELAKKLGDARKVVVSNQQLKFTWRNSEQLPGDLIEAVTALKNEPGGYIGMSGSISIIRQLLAAGLLDELHLLVHPIAVRSGMRLFDEGDTAEEAKAMLERAVAAVEADQAAALAAFTAGTGGFRDRDLYVACSSVADGTVTAHGADPTMVGRSIYELTDAAGKKFGEEIHAVAVAGEINVVAYVWPRPGQSEAVPKETYVTQVADQVCVVGYYK